MASAKIKATIIASRILAEAEGFLPTALTAEYPTTPMTAAGPIVLKNIIIMITKFLTCNPPNASGPFN